MNINHNPFIKRTVTYDLFIKTKKCKYQSNSLKNKLIFAILDYRIKR